MDIILEKHPKLNNDKEVVITLIKNDWKNFKYVSEQLSLDIDIVSTAIKSNVDAISFINENIALDQNIQEQIYKIFKSGVNSPSFLFNSIPKNLKNHKPFIKKLISINHNCFSMINLKDDKELALLAVQKKGNLLEFASERLKNDKEVVMVAVQQNGAAIKFASENLQKDEEIVSIAIKNLKAIPLLLNEWKNNKELMAKAINYNYKAFSYVSDKLKKDKDLILAAARKDISCLSYSNLKGYKNITEIIDKEGEEFLLSCWNNEDGTIILQVANHPNYLPTIEQINVMLKHRWGKVVDAYKLRQDEWLAKIEENKLRNSI